MYKYFNFSNLLEENRIVTYQNYLLITPWSRVLLEKLTGSAASQEIPRLTFHVPKTMSLFLLRDTSSRNTPPPPPRRTEWGSSLLLEVIILYDFSNDTILGNK